ncbi:T9SS type A sorting domain-containing protein [Fibrella sp. HMF5335]|uniref:T9SS type A sorting domain-containing protein n=1 Tax=Fibrella rubiginis TaxID=2817060 RepID=A0A939GH90_9BACT|nr:T9SS type A sorting domain-containing protein [Fibrella rubiginis]MBO0937753.1 T9SS type A sorting domain-containing protein [Fibrella rubiginis]
MINRYVLRCLVGILCLMTGSVLAQKKQTRTHDLTPYENFALRNRTITPDPIICYGLRKDAFTTIAAPANFAKARRAPTSTFIVDYVGYPADAKAAFQRAVDIWSTLIVSPVPIRIKANWTPLASGSGFVTLGSARPATYFGSPDGAQKGNAYYPVALAEKIARRSLNSPDSADIVANFNSNNSWYLGLDAKPGPGTTDLVSVVLHELGHGLGFTGFIRADATNRVADNSVTAVFDQFIENNTGIRLADPQSFSTASLLYNQLVGRNLYLNGPVLRQKTGDRAKLYAPTTYSSGSTLYHLDETTYPAGTPNSLMTPNIANAEAIQNPGPIVLSFFEDMEWKTTSLLHDPIDDRETGGDVVVRARVISDTTLGATPPQLRYRIGNPTNADTTYQNITMTLTGTANGVQSFSAAIPSAAAQAKTVYYLRTNDGVGRTYTNPGRNINNVQYYYAFTTGVDRVAPKITHTPDQTVLFAAAADTIPIIAKVTDDRRLTRVIGARRKVGIDTVYIEYQINGQAKPIVPMLLLSQADSLWGQNLIIPRNTLKAGDKISYRIVARDLAAVSNQAVSPATGFYDITIVGPQATVRTQYVNDFANVTTSTADFVGSGFSVTTPAGFSSPSINSDHPYKNGSDAFNEANFTYTLLAPIKVKANPDSAKIKFDEIVLVEPGTAGTVYGDAEFFDYVIVEGSKDNGRTWYPLINGYDSGNNSTWLAAWNASQVPGLPSETNSGTLGTPALLKSRSFGIQDQGYFRGDDIILVRFRLFADQLAHGWGWQVDNLQIQVPPPPPILATEPTPTMAFSVYPNPVSGTMRVAAELSLPATEATLTLTSPTGQSLRQVAVPVSGRKLAEQLDVSQLPAGLYFLQLTAGDIKQTKKIMVVK